MRKMFFLIILLYLSLSQSGGIFAQKKATTAAGKLGAKSSQASPILTPEQAIINLRAFAKLYGYVRYFHPSDEAARMNWGKFAVYGAQKVKGVRTNEELQQTLKELFNPIAPTLQILRTSETPLPVSKPENLKGLKIVAWQHKGVGVGMRSFGDNTPYQSARLNRGTKNVSGSSRYGGVRNYISESASNTADVYPVRQLWGKEIKFSAVVRADVSGEEDHALMWLRVDRNDGLRGFFSDAVTIRASAWNTYTIVGTVDTNAATITFGCMLHGKGKVWVDDIRLFTRAISETSWKPIPIANGDFEKFSVTSTGRKTYKEWAGGGSNYLITPSTETPYEGENCALIESVSPEEQTTFEELFVAKPNTDELIIKQLGGGLQCAFPVALYADSASTLGSTPESRAAFEQLLYKSVNPIKLDRDALEQESVRLAESIMAWNALKHFYPYFDVVKVNWDSVLTTTLQATLRSASAKEFSIVMRRMPEALQDGHAQYVPNYRYQMIPCIVGNVEGKPIVLASQDSVLQRGDILLSIDSIDAGRRMQEEIELVSGTPQWKRHKAAENLLLFKNTEAAITIERNGQVISTTVRCGRVRSFPFEHSKMQKISGSALADAVWYVDMAQVSVADIEEKIADLSLAKGIIFDLRGYPNDNGKILDYLTDAPLQSMRWNIPQIIYPDQERVQGYDTNGRWQLVPKKPHIKGKIVFLAGNGTYSQGESILNIVEEYRLGDIVGSTSAGANGNIIMFPLVGSGVITWTGMKVTKHDGSQHHLVGIKPTVPSVRTLKGIQEGRDEVLEKALSLIP